MTYAERLNNIYVIDTRMFGFEHYMSAYIVQGKEVALVDTGFPAQMETVRAAVRAHGFDIADISRIFISHSHPDHSGNVGTILRENPRTTVYIHPLGVTQLVDPSIELEVRKRALPERMHAGIGIMEPVAPDRIHTIRDGDTFDLGDGEVLRAVYAPGHQPDGIIFYEAKNNGLFINDLVGNYFPDAGAHYALNPPNSDPRLQINSLEKALFTPSESPVPGPLWHTGRCRGNPADVHRQDSAVCSISAPPAFGPGNQIASMTRSTRSSWWNCSSCARRAARRFTNTPPTTTSRTRPTSSPTTTWSTPPLPAPDLPPEFHRLYKIGIDIGGTFTDCIIIDDRGRSTIAKAPSNAADPAGGVMEALAAGCLSLGLATTDVLARCDTFIHGCTIATNAMIERTGARTAFITTRGHEDLLLIGKANQKVAGLSELEIIHTSRLNRAEPPLVPRDRTFGVTERVTWNGEVLVPLREEEVAAIADDLGRARYRERGRLPAVVVCQPRP